MVAPVTCNDHIGLHFGAFWTNVPPSGGDTCHKQKIENGSLVAFVYITRGLVSTSNGIVSTLYNVTEVPCESSITLRN